MSTGWAVRRTLGRVVTEVADDCITILVPGQCDIAGRAFDAGTAAETPDGWGETSQIQEKYDLSTLAQRCLDAGP